jgi:outer membrane protein OmpA-like peptidoglycan-associated protein
LLDQKRTTKLTVTVTLFFPPYWDSEEGIGIAAYTQIVRGTFNNIVQANGALTFPNDQIDLQGEPNGGDDNKLRFIDGTAWVATKDPKSLSQVIKIKLTVGSQDVVVVSKSRSDTDKTTGSETEINVGVGSHKETTSQPVHSRENGQSRTAGQIWQQRTWTLTLQLPEPKAPPPPAAPTPLTYKVYFDTGRGNADNYRSPLNGNIDQLKGLQGFMKDIEAYGPENVESVSVSGFASELGTTKDNLDLSKNRGNYILNSLRKYYSSLIPPNKMPAEPLSNGSPPSGKSAKDNTPADRRAELQIKIKGGAKRKTP